jgi:hypothetical protein
VSRDFEFCNVSNYPTQDLLFYWHISLDPKKLPPSPMLPFTIQLGQILVQSQTLNNGFQVRTSLSKQIPFYLVPDPDNGHSVSSWIASTYAFTNAISFCEISTADMMTVLEMMVSESHSLGSSAIFCHALGIESGPCGFLTVLPMVEEGAQYVSIVHALRRCGNWSRVHSFIGDTQPPRLPTIKLEPKNGLETYLRPSYKSYCDSDRVNTFYDSQPEDTLLPNEGPRIKGRFGSLIFIPSVWVPAFTEPLLPIHAPKRVTYSRILCIG